MRHFRGALSHWEACCGPITVTQHGKMKFIRSVTTSVLTWAFPTKSCDCPRYRFCQYFLGFSQKVRICVDCVASFFLWNSRKAQFYSIFVFNGHNLIWLAVLTDHVSWNNPEKVSISPLLSPDGLELVKTLEIFRRWERWEFLNRTQQSRLTRRVSSIHANLHKEIMFWSTDLFYSTHRYHWVWKLQARGLLQFHVNLLR